MLFIHLRAETFKELTVTCNLFNFKSSATNFINCNAPLWNLILCSEILFLSSYFPDINLWQKFCAGASISSQKIIVLIFSLIVFNGFGQKKELKSAEKALKSKNFVAAKENIVAAEKFDLLNADLKTKAKYHYIKGVAYYADGESSLDDSFIALENFKKVISLEEDSTYKTYTDKVSPLKTAMLNNFVEEAKNALDLKDYKTSYSNLESAFRVSPLDTLYLYNAALLATSIIANTDEVVRKRLISWRFAQTKSVKKNPK